MKQGEETKKAGQPTKYREEFNSQAFFMTKLGAKDSELCEFFKICESTLSNWKNEHPEFLVSIKSGKDEFDTDRIEGALRHRALGYDHPEEKIFNNNGEIIRANTTKHYPPDTAALIFWLKNRNPERWRDKQEIDLTSVEIPPITFTPRPRPNPSGE